MRVFVNVLIVVEVNEVVVGRLAKDGEYRQQQKTANGQHGIGPSDLRRRVRGEAVDLSICHFFFAIGKTAI